MTVFEANQSQRRCRIREGFNLYAQFAPGVWANVATARDAAGLEESAKMWAGCALVGSEGMVSPETLARYESATPAAKAVVA